MTKIEVLEKDVENFLCKDGNLKKHLGIKFIANQFRTPVGVIDIVGYNVCTKRFVIIELKKDNLDVDALLQLTRYREYIEMKIQERNTSILHKNFLNKINRSVIDYKVDYLLLGRRLDSKLHSTVEYWDWDRDISLQFKMFYRIFNFTLESGVRFDYYSVDHEKHIDTMGVL